ncbi:unnamed protein product [Strongylus vulgaris]|uniref:Uncharacterized protein n=1 Tax=Strongylus vulgaris TaxID=40348 RepID=A0A3P7KUX6_STRVU|nr:unnamed protein product [Strongylus vulgaris]
MTSAATGEKLVQATPDDEDRLEENQMSGLFKRRHAAK